MIPSPIKALILDMDGVLWRGNAPIGNLPAVFARLREKGLRYTFATNNGSRTPEQYVERLAGFGVPAEPWQIITSSMALAELMARDFQAHHRSDRPLRIFAIGEIGLLHALRQRGFEILDVEEAEKAEVVAMGIDRQINFQKMVEATLLVRAGHPFYATNPDKTFPTPRGEIPGAGAWISVIITATGVEPIYAGKPAPYLLELARQRLGTTREETLVVGDRLETDIAAGQAASLPCALVLSGVSTRQQAEDWRPKIDLIAQDLTALVD